MASICDNDNINGSDLIVMAMCTTALDTALKNSKASDRVGFWEGGGLADTRANSLYHSFSRVGFGIPGDSPR